MTLGFISDTHGYLDDFLRASEILKDANKILHLGDVLAHGPRNAIIEGYNPKSLGEILKNRDDITYLRGNCDADVDEMVTGKDISKKEIFLEWEDLKIFATHGYLESEEDRIKKAVDLGANVIITGHTHIKVAKKVGGILILNPGSTSLPKDESKSLIKYQNKKFYFINVENGEIIKTFEI